MGIFRIRKGAYVLKPKRPEFGSQLSYLVVSLGLLPHNAIKRKHEFLLSSVPVLFLPLIFLDYETSFIPVNFASFDGCLRFIYMI